MMTKKCKYAGAFTLVELMLVIFIVGILSAVSIPMMRARVDTSKWSEGKAMAGSIRTAARAYCSEKGENYTGYGSADLASLGFLNGDLDGKYFTDECFAIQITGFDNYLITIDATQSLSGDPPVEPQKMTLDQTGRFIEID